MRRDEEGVQRRDRMEKVGGRRWRHAEEEQKEKEDEDSEEDEQRRGED